jgi:hypothetical protein
MVTIIFFSAPGDFNDDRALSTSATKETVSVILVLYDFLNNVARERERALSVGRPEG